jgi:hypothetical protein
MINEPIKITNLETLQREKQRLKIYCSYQEEHVKDKINFIKSNYKQIIGEEFLPFNTDTNKKVSNVLDWVNEFILGKVLNIDVNGENKLPGSLIKTAEVIIVRLFNNLAKKWQ